MSEVLWPVTPRKHRISQMTEATPKGRKSPPLPTNSNLSNKGRKSPIQADILSVKQNKPILSTFSRQGNEILIREQKVSQNA